MQERGNLRRSYNTSMRARRGSAIMRVILSFVFLGLLRCSVSAQYGAVLGGCGSERALENSLCVHLVGAGSRKMEM